MPKGLETTTRVSEKKNTLDGLGDCTLQEKRLIDLKAS